MGQKNNKWDALLAVLYEHPGTSWTLRDLAKAAKIPRSTVQVYVKQLRKEGLIDDNNVPADSTVFFRLRKTWHFIDQLCTSGLFDYLVAELRPSCIILFGAVRKGESTSESDIDLFVETSEKKQLDLSKYEKKLRHPIHLFVEHDMKKLPSHLYNNVVNGIKLYGSFKVV